jgi:beta-galactosidase
VPVYVYTNYPSAELFINGKSYGKKTFDKTKLLDTYRLRWENTVYQPGELKVVAYNADGSIADTKITKTAGKPAKIILSTDRNELIPDTKDLAFVTVSILDKDGNLCPLAENLVNFKISGAGTLRAVGNGNPASLEPFEASYRKAFYGRCMVILQSTNELGMINVTAESDGLTPSTIQIQSSKNVISNAKIN